MGCTRDYYLITGVQEACIAKLWNKHGSTLLSGRQAQH